MVDLTQFQPSAPALERLPFGAPVEQVMEMLNLHGAVILENVLSANQIARLNADVDPKIDQIDAGLRDGRVYDGQFFGNLTKRVTNLVMTSPVFREEIMADETILSYQDAILQETATDYWMTATQVIELLPGQTAQGLHRDYEAWPFFLKYGPEIPNLATTFIIALTDSTEEMGATRVIPGSHKWPDYHYRGELSMTVPAVLKPGDGLLALGTVLHAGGANKSDRNRRIIALAYNTGWLTPEEAYPLSVPLEIAKQLTPRAQKLIGFRSFRTNGSASLWTHDMGELADHLGLPN